jgi:hypothetical protein
VVVEDAISKYKPLISEKMLSRSDKGEVRHWADVMELSFEKGNCIGGNRRGFHKSFAAFRSALVIQLVRLDMPSPLNLTK